MKVEWLTEARAEYRQFLQYYKTEVGLPYAKKFADTILGSINQLAEFPEMGAVKYDTLMGKHGFRALFMGNYVCVYRIEGDTVTGLRAIRFMFITWPMPERIISTISSVWSDILPSILKAYSENI